jgi:hypothetical protein
MNKVYTVATIGGGWAVPDGKKFNLFQYVVFSKPQNESIFKATIQAKKRRSKERSLVCKNHRESVVFGQKNMT